ncbi:zinc ribbon domain-containing protein [Clostridium vincentii]|uniref:Uncharacterized protein n=1 Tax=Clostridium vincentii TaxID=52704 RepID=A0A2T0BIA9_9CLOT|nr:zinc ribbon domain-containing protein [Clostridium vincentii]PRR83583.1 hypothetical protein CLVI_08330 [Clostridium vincentii]
MSICKKCGEIVKENAKFCTKCGEVVNLSDNINISDDENVIEKIFLEDGTNEVHQDKKTNKKKVKIILFAITTILIVSIAGTLTYIKINSNPKDESQRIDILNADTTNYPNISIRIKTDNYSEDIVRENFTVKEDESFQKNIQLDSAIEENEYLITYNTSDESTSGKRNIKLAYLENDKEVIAEVNYLAPEKSKDTTKTVNSNNAVNTYDNNEVDIKNTMDKYLRNFIQMINNKDTYYIKEILDLNGSLLAELNDTVVSYKEQNISESLIDHKIEAINKISDTQYEVVIYEKYNIYYGKKSEYKITEFRTTYVVNKIGSAFKVYSIKKIDNLGSK